MKELELMWLAGLLEGEGSFLKGPPSQPHIPRISLQMTDGDVVSRAADLMQVGHKVKPRRRQNPNWKPVYQAVLTGKRAVALMKALKPHMGARRQTQIAAAIDCFADKSITISDSRVHEIRAASRTKTQREVAAEFSISRETVNRIVNRKGRYSKI